MADESGAEGLGSAVAVGVGEAVAVAECVPADEAMVAPGDGAWLLQPPDGVAPLPVAGPDAVAGALERALADALAEALPLGLALPLALALALVLPLGLAPALVLVLPTGMGTPLPDGLPGVCGVALGLVGGLAGAVDRVGVVLGFAEPDDGHAVAEGATTPPACWPLP